MGKEDEITSSATGDFAFSAESGTVWMIESSWYNSGQLVPDQVTPASDELPIVNGQASAGISTSYSRGDHIHPQQLTYDGNVAATKFIKTGGTATQILLVDGTNKSITDFNTSVAPKAFQIDPADGIYLILSGILEYRTDIIDDLKLLNQDSTAIQNQFINNGGVINGTAQINPNTANYSQGLRISTSAAGCGLTIGLSNESGAANRGLRISADGKTLSFNGSVIAGTGAQSGASNGSVNYSAGNPILWGVNSVDTNGGFYSDGPKIY
ncbi:MAG: hypothetical protein EZS28_010446 [Streblomastix strix]|uniref:Uncharacterized protein n=1 Tax=Streblomastix strix TaxID=222440 RepID=A0A5J4WI39_9EUKA|nr:MAG: hypothetical protein EZS28_010446 [Streblomastix strix]